MNHSWSATQRGVVAGAALVVLVAGLKAAAPFINLLLLAAVIRLSMEPAYLWLRRRGVGRSAAVAFTVGGLVITVVAAVALLGAGIAGLRDRLLFYEGRMVEVFESLLATAAANGIDLHGEGLSRFAGPARILSVLRAVAAEIAVIISDMVIVLLVVTFWILDQPRVDEWLENTGRKEAARERWRAVGADVRTYLSLTGWLGLIAAVLNLGLFLVVGVDGAAVWAMLSFLLCFVPNLGFVIALVPPTMIALLGKGPASALAVAAGMTAINFVLDNVIKPRFMQRGLELPGSLTIVSLIVWTWVLGPIGGVLGVPLTVVLRRVLLELRTPGTDARPA